MTPEPYYRDDAVTLYCGDCRDVLPSLGSVDAIVTDPPYSVSMAGERHDMVPGKGSRNFDFFEGDDDWPAMTAAVVERVGMARALVPAAGSAYVFCGHRQFGPLVEQFEGAGWSTRLVVWAKKCPAPAPPGSGWPSGAELCIYAYRPGRTWNHRPGDGPTSNVLVFDGYRHGQPGKVDHPTQKPLGLITTLLLASTKPRDVILDPFAGSGTTLRAAKDLGRRVIGIEKEERYCALAVERLGQEVFDFGEVDAPSEEAA